MSDSVASTARRRRSELSVAEGDTIRSRRVMARTEQRRLYRSTDDRILAGVCGGLAQHLDIDVRAVRVGFAVLAFVGGTGLILYAAFWAIVPQRPDGGEPARRPRGGPRRRR